MIAASTAVRATRQVGLTVDILGRMVAVQITLIRKANVLTTLLTAISMLLTYMMTKYNWNGLEQASMSRTNELLT